MPKSNDFGYLRSFANKSGQRYVDLHYFPNESCKRDSSYLTQEIDDLFQHRKQFFWCGRVYNEISETINAITRKNSEKEFYKIDCPWIEQLTFDLHNFTLQGALNYVQEIVKKMRDASGRLVHGDETIVLITGKGNENDENEAAIKEKLLEVYIDQIEVDKDNLGRLRLTLRQKMVYSSCIPAYFFT